MRESVALHETSLDMERGNAPGDERLFLDYLVRRNRGEAPDLVIAIANPAMRTVTLDFPAVARTMLELKPETKTIALVLGARTSSSSGAGPSSVSWRRVEMFR